MSLCQKPRSGDEGALFGQALSVMGDVYASALGVTVMRHCTIPERPAELDGDVVVLVKPGGDLDGEAGEAALRSALEAHGAITAARFERAADGAPRWRVIFASHAAAEAAAAAAVKAPLHPGATAVFCYFNGRDYLGEHASLMGLASGSHRALTSPLSHPTRQAAAGPTLRAA